MENVIKIRGARQNNLKNVNIDIPKNKLVVFTGVSGSGKSSLAFDTIYAEGQRRYVESLSTYARQFLGIMEKPDVDLIEGLSPAISIDQKTTSKNPRSTVGTVTEIYDYLRLLFARIGHPHCPVCGREIKSQSVDEIVNHALDIILESVKSRKTFRCMVLSPVVNDKKGEFSSLFENLKAKGFSQVRIDGTVKNLDDDFVLIKTNKHTIEVVIDRISMTYSDIKDKIYLQNVRSRLSDSIESAIKLSDGLVILSEVLDATLEFPDYPKKTLDHLFSEKFACPIDNIQLPEIEPRTFSFNSPHGACPACNGLGKILKVDPYLVLQDELSIMEGGILPFSSMFEHDTWYSRLILAVCAENDISIKTPIGNLEPDKKKILLYGTGDKEYKVVGTNKQGRTTQIFEKFAGVVKELEKRHMETESDWARAEIEKYMREKVCGECNGTRLKKEALGITIDGKSITDVTAFNVTLAKNWCEDLLIKDDKLTDKEKNVAKMVIREISERLQFLIAVGLEYLTLDREAGTLSGGEAQRIRLASQIGSGLTGVLYVLDEPTIGLHPRDSEKLIVTLKRLRDLGNTVIVVEHDKETIEASDYIFDFGPEAGKNGGQVVAEGTLEQIKQNEKSLTGKFLSGKRKVEANSLPNFKYFNVENKSENKLKAQEIKIYGCNQFNLKNIDVSFPLGRLVVLTGVSGSGKSTLLVETLYPALQSVLNSRYKGSASGFKRIEGEENINKVILIDQSPIGRTPRSNPATYTKVFDMIRDVFACTKDAKVAGYKKGRFSFNVKGGRCEACEGQGQTRIEMQFMSDIWIDCEVCHGDRYNSQTLEVQYRGKNIAEVLAMTVCEAIEFFHSHPKILAKLETLSAVGLDYIELGQPATTLSGGEAQRVKLATELARRDTGRTVYILDEPTTGLHFADVERLLRILKLLVAKGNSVFVIEHNIDVIKNADWIIDLGPEGGDKGGQIVAQGTPKDIAMSKESFTAKFLSDLL
ncbi:MAG: excinuclease ABC subunit UvrA [Patescibacteria group bacterium]|nr:excinuclease ABC subunit UvrA [Patescibacteria group bacterium]